MKQNVLAAILLATLLAAALSACSAEQRKEKGKAVGDAIDTVVIQRPKVEAGVRAARKIRQISAEHQQDLNEISGGKP